MNTVSLSGLLARFRSASRPQPQPQPQVAAPPVAPVEPAAPAASAEDPPGAGPVGLLDMRMSGWFNKETNEAAPGFPISAEDVVVDVGAGDGGLAGFCAQRARETTLIDQDAARLEGGLQRLLGDGCKGVRGLVGDAAALELPDAVASRVICTEVLEHVDDPRQVMSELVRIGRPGALYLITVPNAVSEGLQKQVAPDLYFQKPNHIRIFEREAFTKLVEDAGLSIETHTAYGFFWSVYLTFWWQSGVELGVGSSPLLDAWVRTYAELLNTPDGLRIKAALDQVAPRTEVIVARKPG